MPNFLRFSARDRKGINSCVVSPTEYVESNHLDYREIVAPHSSNARSMNKKVAGVRGADAAEGGAVLPSRALLGDAPINTASAGLLNYPPPRRSRSALPAYRTSIPARPTTVADLNIESYDSNSNVLHFFCEYLFCYAVVLCAQYFVVQFRLFHKWVLINLFSLFSFYGHGLLSKVCV